MDPLVYISNWVFQPVIDLFTNGNILIGLAVLAGSALGLVVAYITSGGPRLYTRPFVTTQ